MSEKTRYPWYPHFLPIEFILLERLDFMFKCMPPFMISMVVLSILRRRKTFGLMWTSLIVSNVLLAAYVCVCLIAIRIMLL